MSSTSHARPDTPKVFREHLLELRSRLLACILWLIGGTVLGYLVHATVLRLLIAPLNQPVFYNSPSGGFDFVLQMSFLFGFVVTVPIFLYHVLRFVEPILPERSPRQLLLLLLASCALLICGMAFAYFVSLPAALYFLDSFTPDSIQALISTSEYFSFVTRYLLGFGVLFQLPLILLVINTVQPLRLRQLLGYEKWVILASFIVAAFLTPTPDIFNQLLMAVPLIILYQISILAVWVVNKKHSPQKRS